MLVGLFCAAANYAIVLAVDAIEGHYFLGVLAGFLVVTPIGYVLHCLCTFGEKIALRSFLRFAATIVTAYPLAIAVVAFLCSGLEIDIALAYPISIAVMFVWNFAASHWAISPDFRTRTMLTSKVAKP